MQKEIYNVIAKLLLSTKRKGNRLLSIIEIAEEIIWLKEKLGNLNLVANELKISTGMLNRFLSVYKLDENVQHFVKDRKIDSIELVTSLAKFSKPEQLKIVNYFFEQKLTQLDIKVLCPLRKQFPEMEIEDVINKLILSKNIKISVIQFYIEDLKKDKDTFEKEIIAIVGKNNFHSLNIESTPCSLKITNEGVNLLRKEAKKRKIILSEFIKHLLNNHV